MSGSGRTVDESFYRAILLEAARRRFEDMDEETRIQLVTEAVRDELKDIDVAEMIEPLIKQFAIEKTREVLQQTEFDKRFQAAVEDGVNAFLRALPKATAVAMVGMFTGIKDYNAGSIYKAFQDMIQAGERRAKPDSPSDNPF